MKHYRIMRREGALSILGKKRTKEEIHEAEMRGLHKSALAEEAIAHFAAEAKGKVASNQARLVQNEKCKGNLLAQMKVSPISATPHKSKSFRSIPDV